MNRPKLFTMVVWHDQTVPNAIELVKENSGLDVDGWGFKDIGLPREKLLELAGLLKATGRPLTMEIMTETEDEWVESAKFAVECGVDCAMGGAYSKRVLDVLSAAGVGYYPFIGRLEGNPHMLQGTVDEIVKEAVYAAENGVEGVCVPVYRYVGDVQKLLSELTRSVKKPISVAGSIDSEERLLEMKEYGIAYLNIGSSFFTQDFVAGGSFADNVNRVMQVLRQA